MHFLSDILPAILAGITPAAVAGALGVTANCLWPLLRTRKRILAVQVLSSCLFALHYGLLGAPTAAAMCATGATQGLAVSLLRKPLLRNLAVAATIVFSLVVTALTWSGLPSVLALGGLLMAACGRLQRDPQHLRLAFLGSEAFWTNHNLVVGSVWGLTADTMAVSMILIGLWRGMRERRRTALPAPVIPARAVAAGA
ncbi:YgjV family protein [Rhodovastum atsumiense]|nr:YgjV family protein [Rhodovastum atsumiense]CAH2600289.1 YgjV family protein [Rhodovastum atsumiense]